MNDMTEAPGIGHNVGETEFDKLKKRGEDLEKGGAKWLDAEDRQVIADQETADKLATFLKQCVALRSWAKKQKPVDKQPSLDESDRIETAYKKVLIPVAAIETVLAKRATAFELEKKRKIQEERDAAAEVERLAVAEAQRLAQEAEKSQSSTSIRDSLIAAEQAEEAAAALKETVTRDTSTRDVIGGGASGLKKKLSAEIVDFDKALAHYATTTELRDFIQTMANASARNVTVAKAVDGQEVVPGVTMKITETV